MLSDSTAVLYMAKIFEQKKNDKGGKPKQLYISDVFMLPLYEYS